MIKLSITTLCAFVWGTVAGVSLAIMAAGNAQDPAPEGIGTLYIDGQPCGTLARADYELDSGDFYAYTVEGAPDCGPPDRIFSDRFEDTP